MLWRSYQLPEGESLPIASLRVGLGEKFPPQRTRSQQVESFSINHKKMPKRLDHRIMLWEGPTEETNTAVWWLGLGIFSSILDSGHHISQSEEFNERVRQPGTAAKNRASISSYSLLLLRSVSSPWKMAFESAGSLRHDLQNLHPKLLLQRTGFQGFSSLNSRLDHYPTLVSKFFSSEDTFSQRKCSLRIVSGISIPGIHSWSGFNYWGWNLLGTERAFHGQQIGFRAEDDQD